MLNRSYLIFQRFLFLVGIQFALRIFYFLYNHSLYTRHDGDELFNALLLGVRFDAMMVVKINLLFFLIWLFPSRFTRKEFVAKTVMSVFYAVNSFFFALNIADIELVHFNGHRLTFHYLHLMEDIRQQSLQLSFYYWPLFLILIAVSFVLVLWLPQENRKILIFSADPSWRQRVTSSLSVFFLLLLFFLSARGGFQNKPLREAHAFRFKSVELGLLALNTSFTFFRSARATQQNLPRWVREETISTVLEPKRKRYFPLRWQKPQNVVILIMESFALEYIGAANNGLGYTPFLDELSQKSLFFKNFFSNGRRSIEAVPSILASVPSLLNEPFLTSGFQGAKLVGLGHVFRRNGYQTAFFHGAKRGSMFFDSFAMRSGFEKYYGLEDYPASQRDRDYDGFWGILDEPYFQYVAKELQSHQQPFAAAVFSLSSHQPYPVPKEHKERFPKGTLEIHQSIGYADFSLRRFFETASRQPWYKDTLFVITADHTQKSDHPDYQDLIGPYRVPLVLFHPSVDLSGFKTSPLAQHVDIMPTLLDMLSLPSDGLSFIGRSIFSRDRETFVVNRAPDGFWYLSDEFLLQIDSQEQILAYRHRRTRSFEKTDIKKVPEKEVLRFKSYVQYFINGITGNKLYPSFVAAP